MVYCVRAEFIVFSVWCVLLSLTVKVGVYTTVVVSPMAIDVTPIINLTLTINAITFIHKCNKSANHKCSI